MLAAAKASSPAGQQAWREPGDKACGLPKEVHMEQGGTPGPSPRPPAVSTWEPSVQRGCGSCFVLSTEAQRPGPGLVRVAWLCRRPGNGASRARAAGSERLRGEEGCSLGAVGCVQSSSSLGPVTSGPHRPQAVLT